MSDNMNQNPADLQKAMLQIGEQAKAAARVLATATTADKNNWLNAMADALDSSTDAIINANKIDMENGKANGLSDAMLDRLLLTPERIHAIADAVRHVVTLDDPAGKILSTTTRPNGLRIDKVSVPIGVIGIIYESRPNVTVDAATLCLKAGNAVILRGGSEAIHSNLALADCISKAAIAKGMPAGAVQVLPWTTREAVGIMLKMDSYLNLIIPRGGERLIRTVVEQSTIPVIKHYKGVCHIFVDKVCDFDRALEIIENAKCQRPGVCNALETLLIHKDAAAEFVPRIVKHLRDRKVELRGCAECCKLAGNDVVAATEDDWYAEYLTLILAMRIVDDVNAAMDHINHYGSGHSDCILTTDMETAEIFLNGVDSSSVYVNASTRFTDGGEFGMGAEIGISTDKLHARGPMGLPELTTYKYKVYGSGQIR
jgi:glutamate-5-semialdehyde dehydrogenase